MPMPARRNRGRSRSRNRSRVRILSRARGKSESEARARSLVRSLLCMAVCTLIQTSETPTSSVQCRASYVSRRAQSARLSSACPGSSLAHAGARTLLVDGVQSLKPWPAAQRGNTACAVGRGPWRGGSRWALDGLVANSPLTLSVGSDTDTVSPRRLRGSLRPKA